MIPPTIPVKVDTTYYRRSYEIVAKIVYALLSSPQTTASLSRRLGMKPYAIRRAIASLRHKDHKCIHISGWERSRTTPLAVYELGRATDVPRPRTTSTQREQRRRAKAATLEGAWRGVGA